jgi:hypothetical protein
MNEPETKGVEADTPETEEPDEIEVVVRHKIKRLNVHFLLDGIAGWFSLEKGFFITVWDFVVKPRRAFEGYLGEERIKYSSPLRLVILITAIAVFVTLHSGSFDRTDAMFEEISQTENADNEAALVAQGISELYRKYFNIFLMLSIPMTTTISWLIYRKVGYNWTEHLALNSFIFAVSSIIYCIVIYPSAWWEEAGLVYLILGTGYQVWAYRIILRKSTFRALLTVILSYGLFAIIQGSFFALYASYVQNA